MSCINELAPTDIKIVQHFSVSPPKGDSQEHLLIPLANFDIVRLRYHLLHFLFFYKFECSESHFLNIIVPNLTNSLSLALKHFLPLAGNIVFPISPSTLPVSRYETGDSVSVAFSGADMDRLTGNHSRDADQFHHLSPRLLPHAYSPSEKSITFSPLAVQLTLFPNQGICIGQTLNHAIADGSTILAFQQACASIHKFNGDDQHLRADISTSYDRTATLANRDLATRAWNYKKTSFPTVSLTISPPTDKVRATFFISVAQIRRLKTFAAGENPGSAGALSSLVVVSGYLWSCLAKSAEAVKEDVDDKEAELLTCTADVRPIFSPPLPPTYFGNCIVLVVAESTHGKLKREDGFVHAARAVGEAIREVKSKRGNGFDDLEQRKKLKGKRMVTVAASPRFDYYGVDYGWGGPEKVEYPTNDCDGSIFTCMGKGGGGIEIGMSMPKRKMDAFATFFHRGITETIRSYL